MAIPALIIVAMTTLATLALLGCARLSTIEPRSDVAEGSLEQGYLYDALIFEIAPLTSCSPDPAALDQFRSSLERFRICRAESVVFVVLDEIGPEEWVYFGTPYWSYATIGEFEDYHRRSYDHDLYDRVGIIFVPYIAGPVMRREGVTYLGGLQYSQSAFAVWKDGSELREAEVLLHEMAHLIGIKGDATEPRYHCSDIKCVMWTSASYSQTLFCDDCRRELSEIIKDKRRE